MKHTFKLSTTILALASSAPCLYPELLAYDSFTPGTDPSAGEYIADMGSAWGARYALETGQEPIITGFTGPWTHFNGPFSLGSKGLQPSLSYSDGTNDVQTAGNTAYREVGVNTLSSRSLDIQGMSVDGNTFYFSFLVKLGASSTNGNVAFSGYEAADGNGLQIGTDGTDFVATVGFEPTIIQATDAETTHMFVWKVEFGAVDNWSLWMDPTDLSTETQPDLTGSTFGLSITTLVLNRVPGGSSGAVGFEVDEIRIGTTWDAVTTVSAGSSTTWAGFPIDENGYVDTGSWLGILYVTEAPWVYSFDLENWMYIDPSGIDASGSWVNILK